MCRIRLVIYFHYQCIKRRLNVKQYYDSPAVNFHFHDVLYAILKYHIIPY